MRTYPTVIRVFEKEDYLDIKRQAKECGVSMKDLARDCGLQYSQFFRILHGMGDGTKVAERLLKLDYTIIERR